MNASISSLAVHPRGRGEQFSPILIFKLTNGSSPRARGTASRRHGSCAAWRFIPAGAGNRSLPWPPGASPTVHPRGRGEQLQEESKGINQRGSSPRARGTVNPQQRKGDQHRFIPAGAGNRSAAWTSKLRLTVHPRGRGEQAALMSEDLPPERFIPAGAGNSSTFRYSKASSSVHPRGRGEQPPVGEVCEVMHGSSPRARGTADVACRYRRRLRFIPAGAGNRRSVSRQKSSAGGSSPRARGTERQRPPRSRRIRFIPAGAGNRAYRRHDGRRGPVHPRGRGEQT